MELWYPLVRDKKTEAASRDRQDKFKIFDEIWVNNVYTVFVRRGVEHNIMEDWPPMTWLSIKRNDKAPCNDWRHFQWIKNQLVGDECEGVQLYPAESRLVDGSNQYHIWCFEKPVPEFFFPFGFTEGRQVTEHPMVNGKQRAFPKNMRPADLEEQHKLMQEQLKKYNLK